ncbi:MAG: monovalent cation/H(+) antiporter subunit G [Oscillospiraceae bacterium]|nr:monovalent cation/H(+) antiporter subunit G [Oscillospiraceae bacterium]
MIRIIIGSVLILLGLFVCCVAVLGLFRFRYVMSRMHAAALGDTMGLFLTLAGTVVLAGLTALSAKIAIVWILMWIASPVASHLIARMEILLVGTLPDGSDREEASDI